MIRTRPLAVALAGLALIATPGVALAQDDETGPASKLCTESKALVVDLEVQVRDTAATELASELEILADAKAELPALTEAVRVARRALETAEAAGALEPVLVPLRGALTTARQALRTQEDVVAQAQAAVDADSTGLLGLRARLQLAIDQRERVCAVPVPPTPVTPTPTPAPAPPAAADDDEEPRAVSGSYSQVGSAPVGSVATGGR